MDLLDEEDPARLHEAVAVAARWPGDAEALARGIEDQNHDLLRQWVPQVRAAVVWLGRWGHTINNAQNEYNDTTLYSLAVTADLLHRLAPEPVIEEDSLAGLVTLVQEVMDAVVGDDELSPEAREFLLSRLIDVQNALMYFRIRGYPGVEDAMDQLVGGLVRTPAAQSEQSKAGIKRIWAAIQGALTGPSRSLTPVRRRQLRSRPERIYSGSRGAKTRVAIGFVRLDRANVWPIPAVCSRVDGRPSTRRLLDGRSGSRGGCRRAARR